MSGLLHRATSMMGGDGINNRLGSLAHGNDSPLQVFVRAKKKINDIFVEIQDFTKDSVNFLQDGEDKSLITSEELQQVILYVDKVKAIRDVLCRDHMKVAFFGRTSNGKSTVINAMLHEKILPSGIGHTTNCFLQVEGSDNNEAYLVTRDSQERLSVQSVGQLAHALCDSRLQECELVNIFWPREKCGLLRDDVVFVDSPGVDVTPNLDQWIDNHCLDADVFVLVANAESTLMVTEKNFFHKVSSKLSNPNIFILNNRWDASASEPEYLDQVRSQHMSRCVEFLVKELKVCSPKEADERIFFISAKEALLARLKEKGHKISTFGALAEGFQNRYFEFQDFESKFQECISKSAVKTKFAQHSQRGRTVITDTKSVLENVHDRANTCRTEKLNEQREINDVLNYTENQLILITKEMKLKIRNMVEDVEQKVSKALNDEIQRLANLVDEFNLPFHSDQLVLNVYKKELHGHVENGLGSNLKARLSTAVSLNIQSAQQQMTECLISLIPEDKREDAKLSINSRRIPFQVLYKLNCQNLCADFQEDLQFKFSWGITAMIQYFQGEKSHKFALKNYTPTQSMPRSVSWPVDGVDINGLQGLQYRGGTNSNNNGPDMWSIVSKFALSSLTSQGTMGGLLIGGFMLKTVGWRVVLFSCGLYGAVYAYERLTWTNKAKEKVFKKQYVQHASKKLKLIVDLTSANCSHQVQQELSTTFAQLCHLVDEANNNWDTKLRDIDLSLQNLEKVVLSSKNLRNRANYLNNEIDLFNDAFIKTI